MMTLDQIAATITADIDATGTLVLPGDALGSASMAASFAHYLTGGTLVVAGAAIQTTDTAVVVRGTGRGRFAGLATVATFTPTVDDDIAVVIAGTTPEDWILPEAFASLAGSAYDQLFFAAGGSLVLRTLPDAGDDGLTLDAALLVKGLLAGVTMFLTGLSPVPFAGPIDVVQDIPRFNLAATVIQGMTIGTLASLDFTLQLVSTPYAFTRQNADGTTTPAYTQTAYAALSAPLSFGTKGQPMTVTATMPFTQGPLANLYVAIDGNPGVLLDDFMAWAGGNLFDGMPPPALFNPADYLTLDSLAFMMVPATATLTSFSLTLSTVEDWTIIPDLITVSGVSLALSSLGPAAGAAITGMLTGTVDIGEDGDIARLDVSASAPDFTFAGALADGSTVDCSALVTYLIPSAIGIPSIELTYFEFFAQPAAEHPTYAMTASLSTDWVLDVSPVKMAVTDAYLSLEYGPGEDGGSATTGAIGGTIVFNDSVTFSISYATPGAFQVTGRFDRISLLDSIARLVDMKLPLPDNFDLAFTNCLVDICYGTSGQSQTLEFQISATVPGLGTVAFDALKIGAEWGYATGLDLGSTSIANVPGLSALLPFADYFKFKKLVMVVSTADLPNFAFANQIPLPPGQSIVTGMNAYADIDLNSEPDLSLLMNFLHMQADLSITLQIGVDVADDSSLYASINGTVNSDMTVTGQFGATLRGGLLSLFVEGKLATSLQGQPITFDIYMAFEGNGAFLSGSYIGTIDFVIVKLTNLVVEIGVDLEGIPTIGFGARIDIEEYYSSIMVLLDSINPAQSMFVGSIGDISLGTFLRTLCNVADVSGVPAPIMAALDQTGLSGTKAFEIVDTDDAVRDALNNRDVPAVAAAFATAGIAIPADPLQVIITVSTKNSLWYVTDMQSVLYYRLDQSADGEPILGSLEPQLYVVPQTTQLGPTVVQQGYRANATLDLFGFKASVDVRIADQQGLSIDAEFSRIIITVSNYPVFSLTSADGKTGPALSVCTFHDPTNPDVARQNPHFFADGRVAVLGVLTQSVKVDFTGTGGSFDIASTVAGLATYSMAGSYASPFSFSLSGSALVGVDQLFDFGVLGKVQVQAQVGYSYSVAVTGATSGRASAAGTFRFGGIDFSIPTFDLPLDSDSLAALPDYAVAQVYAALQDFFTISTQWLTWLNEGIVLGIDGAEQVGASLEAAYALAYDAIATQTTDILNYTTDQVTAALEGAGATADQAYEVLVDTLAVPAEEAAKAVEDIFTGSGAHLDEILVPGYSDNTLHVDDGGYSDNTLHVDDKGYNDGTVHIDDKGYSDNTLHVDDKGYNDRTLHIDDKGYNDRTLHVDTKIFGAHDDTGHIDYGHADSGHIDYGHTDTGSHIDTGHTDTGHIDYGHTDTGSHVDTGHTDTGHIDTPATHVDTKI